jgi:pyrroloquinoline quinone (PQQ) biosynthesis protein C
MSNTEELSARGNMEALSPDVFLKQLAENREAIWETMNAERKSYGAEKPLTPAVVLRRLQFGAVMERRAAEVSAPWIARLPDLELQQCLSEYVANELKHASILRRRITELGGDPDALWHKPLPELRELWDYHASLGSFCELFASVQYGHEEFFPRTSKSFIERIQAFDPKTAAIYRDTLLADEEGHEWLAPEVLRRYAVDAETQERCLAALKKGCELFSRAIQSFNRSLAA